MKKIYLAGPMTGIENLNKPAFDKAAEILRDNDYEVFNPASVDFGDYKQNLLVDLSYILNTADSIAMLPGWENSKGARAEHAVAFAIGLKIHYLNKDEI